MIDLSRYFKTTLLSDTELLGFFNFWTFSWAWRLNLSWWNSLIFSWGSQKPSSAKAIFLFPCLSYKTRSFSFLIFFKGLSFFSFFSSAWFLSLSFSAIVYLFSTGNTLTIVPSSSKLYLGSLLKWEFFPVKNN